MVDNILTTLYLAVGLLVAFVAHEYAQALVAVRMGDPTPRASGRLTLDPRPHVDVFGTLVLPGILLLPALFAGRVFPIFAYGKPMPLYPWTQRKGGRLAVYVALAGPVANVLVAVAVGALLRVTSQGWVADLLVRTLQVNVIMASLNLIPIPPLDGSRVIVQFLPPRAADVYRNLDQYGALFILLIFFILPSSLVFSFVGAVGNGICRLVAGAPCL